MKALITFTDGGSRETVQRNILKSIQTKFDYLVAVGVGAYVKDEEIRSLSTKGRSIHVKDFDGKLVFEYLLLTSFFKTLPPT